MTNPSQRNQKNFAVYLNLLVLIPSLVKMVNAFHTGDGASKKAAVIDLAGSFLEAGGAAVAANNPIYADTVSQVIEYSVSALKGSGLMPATGSIPLPLGTITIPPEPATAASLALAQ